MRITGSGFRASAKDGNKSKMNITDVLACWENTDITFEILAHIHHTGWLLNNGPPNTKVNFSCNKRLNFTTKFDVLGF